MTAKTSDTAQPEVPLHVIVQAGGRGSRLRHHTWNKPKCLVSFQGKPILYHLFDIFPDAQFTIIGDYLFDQLESYLETNPPQVDYALIQSKYTGTAASFADALRTVPEDQDVVYSWSDLCFLERPDLTARDQMTVVTTDSFTCRWTVDVAGAMSETPGAQNGVIGLFYFPADHRPQIPPNSGEFVKWLSTAPMPRHFQNISQVEELGDFNTIEQNNNREGYSRFFNKVEVGETMVEKTVVDPDYRDVHANEVAWYEAVRALGFDRIPEIHQIAPLVMSRVKGQHAYRMADLSNREKTAVIADYIDTLKRLHHLGDAPADHNDVRSVYLDKTLARVDQVRRLIPNIDKASVTVNGLKCRNVFAEKHRGVIDDLLPDLLPATFVPIHGDPTFSNSLVDTYLRTWLIDPRGSFAKPGIMGDALYDFSKVYYSAVGGYDLFNHCNFKLFIDDQTVEILMEKPLFSDVADGVFQDFFGPAEMRRIRILHALIWFALSGYAKDDIDSVIASFYLGLYWMEQGLEG